MNNNNEMVKMYETMLSLPSMDETVKFSQGIQRKQVLLLSLMIEKGLGSDSPEIKDLLAAMPESTVGELKNLSAEYLQKAGLTELNEKLKLFAGTNKS
ncbi:hypothetical protein SAMN05216464_11096 [Mucilaginibacter pineti]|uniref:Uncharacterized protein n=1 Tax=Mucilaginibacter pineti TaxID=1391627 RepID=A0A1G7GDV6_9SPHI|nr:hypothetical protein [Mucilaginibacter pineti]SDE86263.1 hypothetical protein SAMN05216464_11096 [Mucilaginibacter pineti]